MDFRSPDNPYPFSREIERRDTGTLGEDEVRAAQTVMDAIQSMAVHTAQICPDASFTRGDLCQNLDTIEEGVKRLRRFLATGKAQREAAAAVTRRLDTHG